jgi:hypothetical protein
VDSKTNREKGDSAADDWLPEDPDQQCDYVTRRVKIKRLYDLSVTEGEQRAMVAVLSEQDCEGGESPLPERSEYRAPKPKPIAEPKPKPDPKPQQTREPKPDRNVYYKNCDAVRASGAAPIH